MTGLIPAASTSGTKHPAYPFYFKTALDKINIDFENETCLPEEKETYRIGEEINQKMKQLLYIGIERGEIRPDIEIMPTIFTFWGMLSGFIQTVSNKEDYIAKELGLSKSLIRRIERCRK